MLKRVAIIGSTVLLQACAYSGHVQSVSGAAEVMPSRRIDADAAVRIDPELSAISKKVNLTYFCSAHNYTLNLGGAISDSIMRTLEGSFRTITRAESQSEYPNAYFLDFSLDEFAPRLRFSPGFFTATPEANTELSIRVRAYRPGEGPSFQTTVRGQGHEEGSGGCGDGMPVVEQATREAIQRAMEDLAQKLINSKALTEN